MPRRETADGNRAGRRLRTEPSARAKLNAVHGLGIALMAGTLAVLTGDFATGVIVAGVLVIFHAAAGHLRPPRPPSEWPPEPPPPSRPRRRRYRRDDSR